jgi:RNA polymerase sigma-70 factor (ECF subfamily)
MWVQDMEGTLMHGESQDLAALLARSSVGDQQAFARFYDATIARAYGLALRVTNNATLAEEVTQEAYLEAWRGAARYDRDRGGVPSWLFTIVRRRAVDRIRAVGAGRRRDAAYHSREGRADEGDTTSSQVHASMDALRVRAALADLTPRQRQVIGLAYYGGLSYPEIAAKLGIPTGTIKSRARAALSRLRDTLEPLPAGCE